MNRNKVAVAVIVGGILAALYPAVIVPLQSSSNGREKLRPGFQKASMWKELDSANNNKS